MVYLFTLYFVADSILQTGHTHYHTPQGRMTLTQGSRLQGKVAIVTGPFNSHQQLR